MNIKSNIMEMLTNELGKKVYCHGSVGSPLWILKKYPRQLHAQVEKYLEQINSNEKNPVITFNGRVEYNLDFVRAVKLYAEHPEWL